MKINIFWGEITDNSAKKEALICGFKHGVLTTAMNAWVARQCFLFSRNIGELTLKIIYFHYLKKYFLD